MIKKKQLSLFGLPDTRRAVAAFRVSSATASEEWDALPASKSAPRRVVDQEGSAWTAPETWAAAAAKQADAERAAAAAAEAEKAGDEPPMAAAAEGEGEGEAQSAAAEVAAVAEALENKKQAAFAADAYAFGMVSWEVGATREVVEQGVFFLLVACPFYYFAEVFENDTPGKPRKEYIK